MKMDNSPTLMTEVPYDPNNFPGYKVESVNYFSIKKVIFQLKWAIFHPFLPQKRKL